VRNALMVAIVLLAFGLYDTSVGQYEINWHTIEGGGDMGTVGGSYTLSGTIGQSDARNHPAPMIGSIYEMLGGFWVVPPCLTVAYDFDADCDVDLDDVKHFVSCVSGPQMVQTDPGCLNADFDLDEDVDLEDFGLLQRCFSGANIPVDPACVD